MVTGIERWKEYFNDYKDKYVLIGGAACNLLEEETRHESSCDKGSRPCSCSGSSHS